MVTWQYLNTQFKELHNPDERGRLDIQWRDDGDVQFSVTGFLSVNNKHQFKALSKLSGKKLSALMSNDNEINEIVLQGETAEMIWYRALWKLSPSFKFDILAYDDRGNIYTGSVPLVCNSSATLALNCLSDLGEEDQGAIFGLKPSIFGFSVDLRKLLNKMKNFGKSVKNEQ